MPGEDFEEFIPQRYLSNDEIRYNVLSKVIDRLTVRIAVLEKILGVGKKKRQKRRGYGK